MSRGGVCRGCGRGVSEGGFSPSLWGCIGCFNRLPLELQQRYRKAVSPKFVNTESTPALRREMEAWWKANPPAPVEPQVPVWRRHKQEGK